MINYCEMIGELIIGLLQGSYKEGLYKWFGKGPVRDNQGYMD